jgi:hypothetical protein
VCGVMLLLLLQSHKPFPLLSDLMMGFRIHAFWDLSCSLVGSN